MKHDRTYVIDIECRWCASRAFARFGDEATPAEREKVISEAVARIEHDPKLCVGAMTEKNDRLMGELFSR